MSELPKTFYDKADRVKFYNSRRWRKLRDEVVEREHHECKECKAEGIITTDRQDDVVLEVDHIQSIIDRPDLVLDADNLQVLCRLHHNAKHEKYKSMLKSHRKKSDEWFG
ncbi:HNH endonuclease [Weissella viridescens]